MKVIRCTLLFENSNINNDSTVPMQYLVHGPAVRALQSNLVGNSTQNVGDRFARVDSDSFCLTVKKVNSVDDRL